LAAIITVSIAYASAPQPAEAGFFSFFDKIWGNETDKTPYNSQNIPLLKAPATSDQVLGTGGTSIDFVEDSSILPVVGPLGSVADVDSYKLDQITTYTVHAGDTISKIADMFGVSVSTIYWANDLKRGDVVKSGDILVILPISGVQYKVKKGDTPKSLAKKFGSNAEEIISYNNLSVGHASISGNLEEGAMILIPDGESSLPAPSSLVRKNHYRGGGPDLAGYFMRPIFGGRNSRATASNPHGLHGFNGVDLADSCGSSVFAAAEGTALVARSNGWNGGYGWYVVIGHSNGTQTLYAHLSSVLVSVGQYVPQGLHIGNIGNSGNSTGCHVHFEIRGAKNPF